MLPLCGSCGTPAEPGDRFCSRCGSPVQGQNQGTRSCARCGSESEASDRFCRNCGSSFAPPETAGPADGDGFEDILAGWELDAPFTADDAPPAMTAGSVPTQVPPVETAVLDRPRRPEQARPEQARPRPAQSTFIEEEPDLATELPQRRARAAGGFPWGATLALLGSVAVIISAILPWDSGAVVLPRDIPATMLLDPAATEGGPNLGLVLLGIGTIGALVALLTMAVPATAILRRLIGFLTFAIPVAFVMRALGISALLDPGLIVASVGIGAFTAAAGGFIQVVAGRRSGRR